MRLNHLSSRTKLRNAGLGLAFVALATLVPSTAASASAAPSSSTSVAVSSTAKVKPTVVLVHGAWADGSTWSDVTQRLHHDGYTVDAVPNPLRGVASDSAYLASYLKQIKGPIVLVGHSYGGFLISNAALGNRNVKALVYIDAYIPAKGDSLLSLTAHAPGSLIDGNALTGVSSAGGVVDTYVKPKIFRKAFANELTIKQGAVLASTQRPLAQSALGEASAEPAWSKIPSWDLIGTIDKVIPAATQKYMAKRAGSHVTTIKAQHLSMISHPKAVESIIVRAAKSTS